MKQATKNKNGHYIIAISRFELMDIFSGPGTCDNCAGTKEEDGFLIPVLSLWYCDSCYKQFEARSKFYPEDVQFEEKSLKRLESLINKYHENNK